MHLKMNHPDLLKSHEALKVHPLYKNIKTIEHLKIFMESHVFAVWDFMSLLKRLQNDITCVSVPWKPSHHPKKLVRMINEIVLGEESDLDFNGEAIDHFTLYLKGMNDIGASPNRLLNLINDTQNLATSTYCSPKEKEFVEFNINLAKNGKTHEVAAAFFFGREKVIPDMFTSILNDLKNNLNSPKSFESLYYYLERHIELDGNEHSLLALECLNSLCLSDEKKWDEAVSAGVQSLKLRNELWNEVLSKLTV